MCEACFFMRQITLQYRKIIDKNASSNWDKAVWNDSFLEYRMKAQYYDENLEFPVFKDLINAKPEAEKLHYLVSLSALGHIQYLGNVFPGVIDTLGTRCIPFQNYTFKILASDFHNKDKHMIQIDFFSDILSLIDIVGDTLWLSKSAENDERIETFMTKLQPNMMINSILS